jgi:chromate transporter
LKLTGEQVALVLTQLEFRDQLLVFLDAGLGTHRGELGALRWMDCDFNNRAFDILVGRLWNRLVSWPWRNSIQAGLAPVSIGLLLAGCFTFARGAVTNFDTAAIAVGTLLVLLKYKINPALLVLAAAIIGVLSF